MNKAASQLLQLARKSSVSAQIRTFSAYRRAAANQQGVPAVALLQQQHTETTNRQHLWCVAAAAAACTASAADSEKASPPHHGSVNLQHRITDNYRFENADDVVGTGNRSKVIAARDVRTGALVAVKKLPRYRTAAAAFQDEVYMMSLAQGHRNCVKLQDTFEDSDSYYIVMELAEGGELYHRLRAHGKYTEGQAARICAELLLAVEHLHQKHIVHFDIKPENVLLLLQEDKVPEVRLADFGSAFSTRSVCGIRDYTTAYSAPEVLQRAVRIDEKADIWSLGVLLFVLLSGRHPFDTSVALDEAEVERRIMFQEPDYNAASMRHVSPIAKDLLRRMMSKDKSLRPSAREALSHDWFTAVAPLTIEPASPPPLAHTPLRRSSKPLVPLGTAAAAAAATTATVAAAAATATTAATAVVVATAAPMA